MENALTILQDQIILGTNIFMLVFSVCLASYFTARITDKTLMGLSSREIRLNQDMSDDDKFYLIGINNTTLFACLLFVILIYNVSHM